MKKKHWTALGLALGVLVLGMLVGLMTVGTVAADPTPGVKIQIPRLDVGDTGNGEWETWIHVQNVSLPDPVTGVEPKTGAIFMGWGDYSGECPTNDPGVVANYCQLIQGNAIWTLKSQIAETVKSAIIYTVREDVFMEACYAAEEAKGDTTAWRCWLEEWEFGTCEGDGGGWNDGPGDAFGEDVAVTVTRYGPNDYGTFVSSTYTGISEDMDGEGAPWEYYAPYVMRGYYGLDTELTIQNSGELCTSVWIDYMQQKSCHIEFKYHVEQLAPGESIRLRVPKEVNLADPNGCGWLGSAHISAEQPLGITVDETSFDAPCFGEDRGTLLTHRARPKVELRDGEPIEDTKVYADLIFREWSNWDASIQVQNLSRTGQSTFVTVDFLDNSGDEVLFLADWVCPGGSETFYLPIVTNLGFDYVGAAEIESHDQVNYPGGETGKQPIFAVVDLKRPDDPLTPDPDAQGGSYNAHPYSQKEWVSQIALPFMAKQAEDMYTQWTSLIAIRNNSNCNKIRPSIHFKDETGTVVCKIQSFWLMPKHVKMFDLNNIGCLWPGYVGAARVYVEGFEQLCDVDQDGHVDNEPLMPSVIVVEKGLPFGFGGDVTNIYEGIPYATNRPVCYGDIFGTVTVKQADHGYDREELHLVNVFLDGDDTGKDTDSTGGYQITHVPEYTHTVKFTKSDFFDLEETGYVECGEDTIINGEMICSNPLTVTTRYSTVLGSGVLPNVLVDGLVTYRNGDATNEYLAYTVTTDNDGVSTVPVAGGQTITGTATLYGYDDATDLYTTTATTVCSLSPSLTFTLCQWNTIVGTATIGGQKAAGYRVDAVRTDTWAVVDTDTTTANGVFMLHNFSTAVYTPSVTSPTTYPYDIRLYNTSESLISTKTGITITTCGATGVITYTDGTWTGPTW